MEKLDGSTNIFMLPLNEIEIKDNIRVMEHDSIKELAQSIKENGLIQAITVMVQSNKTPLYRLITGHRRYQAYVLNKEETIPCFVQPKMDEQEIHTLQIVENIQRETISVIEERKAFGKMKNELNLTPKQIARMIGKTVKYVESRLLLINLIPDISVLVHQGKLTLQHATLFAQCQPDIQEKLLKRIGEPNENNPTVSYESPRQLKQYIKNSVVHPLGTAPFDFDDQKLLPEAGSCAQCSKRSGVHKKLFESIESEDDCFDPDCYLKKVLAWMEQKRTEYEGLDAKVLFLTDNWYPDTEMKKRGWAFSGTQKVFDMPKGKPMKGYSLDIIGIWIDANDPQKNGTTVQILTKEQYAKYTDRVERSDPDSMVGTDMDKGVTKGESEKATNELQKYIKRIINSIALVISKTDEVKIPDAMLRMIGHDLIRGLDDEDLASFLKNFQWVASIPTGKEGESDIIVNHENALFLHVDKLYQANIYRYSGRDLNEVVIYLVLLEIGSRSLSKTNINTDFIYAVEMAKELNIDTENATTEEPESKKKKSGKKELVKK